ncbi:MAG: hypothetical protein KIT34_16535 [Cyanobacteria bacterium TGS_CYA1]|nr:hypothetical protein [Cyanobacteria bacterium TGS_CYA1]
MSHKFAASLLMISCLFAPLAAQAKIDKPAKDWQLKSLKGIKSVKYCATYDPDGSLLKVMDSGLAGMKVTAKAAPFKKDEVSADLGKDEARVMVFVDNRDKDKAWVGLVVRQKSQLNRDSALSYDADTYALGTLTERGKAKDAVKELCAQFKDDLKSNN